MHNSSWIWYLTSYNEAYRALLSERFSTVFMVVDPAPNSLVRNAKMLNSVRKPFIICHLKWKVGRTSMSHSRNSLRAKRFQITSAMHVARSAIRLKTVCCLAYQTTSLSISRGLCSITTSSRTKKWTADGSSLIYSTSTITQCRRAWKLKIVKISITNSRALSYILAQPNMATTSVTSRQAKVSGCSSTTRGSDSLTPKISKQSALGASTGVARIRVPICSFMKRRSRARHC